MKRAIAALTVFFMGCQPFGSALTPLFFSDEPAKNEPTQPQAVLWLESEPGQQYQLFVASRDSIDRDYTEDFYRWSAENGYPQGQEVYGLLLIYDKGDIAQGLDWLHQALEQKYAPAALDLAWLFMQGEKVQRDLDKAKQYLEIALQSSDKDAFRMAAQISLTQKNTAQAIYYLEQAAILGDLQAQRDLAQLLLQEKRESWREAQSLIAQLRSESLVEESSDLQQYWPDNPYKNNQSAPVTTRHYNAQQAGQNSEISESLLPLPYTPASYPQSFYEQFESYAAEGSPYAAYQAALQRLKHPTSTHKMLSSKTLRQLIDSASVEIVPAKVLKARLIFRKYFNDLSSREAYTLLEEAAQQNNLYALFAMSAWMRQMGEYELSVDYYHRALRQENYYDALYQFVFDALEGYYPLQQEFIALDWLGLLVQNFYSPALLLMADLKEKKRLAGTDYEIFLHRYQAAWQGNPEAQYLVGNMYLKGFFVAANPQKAFRWFYQSAYNGYRPAQYQLARHYKNGIGVVPDLAKAYAWRAVSGASLYENDEKDLQELAWQMTQEQLEHALKLEHLYKNNFTPAWFMRAAL